MADRTTTVRCVSRTPDEYRGASGPVTGAATAPSAFAAPEPTTP
ncbi:hypothetical protein ABZZ17_16800 [Streptomyces sp. NPDC006512]